MMDETLEVFSVGEIHEVFSVTDSGCGALLIDADFTGAATGLRMREIYVLRDGDEFGSAPMFRQWVEENNPLIVPYIQPPEPTPEQRRASMPAKSMVELRAALRAVRTEAVPEGIYSEDIYAKIDVIADRDLREEAKDFFDHGQYAERRNPWVDILGAMFGLSPDEIDTLWLSSDQQV